MDQTKSENIWATPIGKWNFAQQVGELGLLDEILQNPDVLKDTKVGMHRISDRKDEFPKFTSFIDGCLRNCMNEYMLKHYNHVPEFATWSAWTHLCLHGIGLVPHYHMGDEYLTSIIYLTESKANLVLRDPRANMVRNWPQTVLKSHFADHEVHPRTGDFVMFPTYIDHYVMATQPDFRVAVAIDWCFE